MSEDKSLEELVNLIFNEEKSIRKNEDRTIRKEELVKTKAELLARIDSLEKQVKDPEKFAANIEASKDQIVNVLGPVIGKMIRKFMATEIEKLNARITAASQTISSKTFWKNTFLSMIGMKKKSSEKIQLDYPTIKEILIIDKSSGLILGKYAKEEMADSDMVAGMFTAIKTFAETTFSNEEKQELGLIDYDDFKIKLQAYGTFYYAVIFSGRFDAEFKTFIRDAMDTFTEDHFMPISGQSLNGDMQEVVNKEMKSYFDDTCKKLEEKLF